MSFINQALNSNDTDFIKKCKYFFVAFCALQLIMWTLLPSVFLHNTYVDILENLAWGRHWQWGYDKNPYFGAWLTYIAYLISGKQVWSAYLLSQISVVTCYWAVWALGKRIMSPLYALIAVTLLIGIHFYTLATPEFNDNTLELPLWALTCLFFYDATKEQRLLNWLLVGVFAGLAMMTKYLAVMLFGPMFVFLLINKEARKSFSHSGLYLAAAVFLLLSVPNFIWLYHNSFISITYAFDRAQLTESTLGMLLRHIENPFRYFLSMLGVVAPVLVIYLVAFRKRTQLITKTTFDSQFIGLLCFGPLAFILFFSLLTGAKLKYMWATPLFNLFGIFLLYWLQPKLTKQNLKVYTTTILIVFSLWLIGFSYKELIEPYASQSLSYETFPGHALAENLTEQWHEKYHRPLKYVAGYRELALNVSQYSPDRPQAYFDWDPQYSQWINEKTLRREGAVFVWRVDGNVAQLPKGIQKRFPRAKLVGIQSYKGDVKDWILKIKHYPEIPPVKIGVAILPPEQTS